MLYYNDNKRWGDSLRLLTISDIHGRFEEFQKLLKFANYHNSDYLINLGDMIDRGKDSYKVVEWFREMNKKTRGRVQTLMGNHEHMFLGYIAGNVKDEDFLNKFVGGDKTIISYENVPQEKMEQHVKFIGKLPLYLEIGDYIFTHGGLDINKPLSQQTIYDTAWDYKKIYTKDTSKYDKIIIGGHTPTKFIYEYYGQNKSEIWKSNNYICIDCTFSKSRKMLLYDVINDIEYYYDFAKKSCYKIGG